MLCFPLLKPLHLDLGDSLVLSDVFTRRRIKTVGINLLVEVNKSVDQIAHSTILEAAI